MKKSMNLYLSYFGGGEIDKEIVYNGDSLEDIARQINNDENDLLDYMLTGDDEGLKSFVFCGFMFRKEGIITAQLTEGVL